ncbi:unnamed protein product, partial [Symbiodinium pilosum]
VFRIVQLPPAEARDYLKELLVKQEACTICSHPPFTGVLLDYFKARDESVEAAQQLQAALYDTALSATCSSQNVEKLHAHAQVSQKTLQNAGPRPGTLQRQTYVMAARILHSRIKGLIEREVFGGNFARARKLMGARVVSRSKAANPSLKNYAAGAAQEGRKRAKFVRQQVLKIQTKALSDEYKTWLSNPQQREHLLEKAEQMAAARQAVSDTVLGADVGGGDEDGQAVDAANLSERQKARLGQARLNKSLAALFKHPAWGQGLRAQDPNTALAASHVLSENALSEQQSREESNALFHFDAQVLENPAAMPSMTRTCQETHGGLCQEESGSA